MSAPRTDAPRPWRTALLALGIAATSFAVPPLVHSWARFEEITIAASAAGNRLRGATVADCPSCATGRRVQGLGRGHTLVVPLHDVPEAGTRILTIVYESDRPRPLYVGVGDQPPRLLQLTGNGDRSTPARTSLAIELPAGDTDLKFFHPSLPTPDLDQIRIS